ncbi:LysR family transcriptional regulator [Streptomyces antnestii]|uniref:LysR family transcriptional regulator n=1 Tax=Streptomyces antnestii TaxID=2494256 RepID=A0A3S2W9C2_9ACTN|nr:LysR family transcriptional regulator [Streptomyces sp. San01]RVU16990.1 LysR family transcriptional regulator [Streptomyces sp. San01]
MAKDANFTLVQLRYFLAAAELGSMTAAAQRINVSQSAVSTAVHHLERELGVQLLIRRHAKGLALTAAGERFLHELRGFLTHADELAESARSLGADLVGELSVGCFQTLAPFYLPRLLREFGERQPAVRVEVVEGDIPGVQDSLRTGVCELALLYEMDLDPDIECEVLAMSPPYALVPEGHRLAEAGRARLADLADEPMILLDLPASRDYFRAVAAKAGVEPRISHRTRSYETVRALVAAGYGWSMLNQRPAHDRTYDGSSVVALPLTDPLPALPVVLAKLRGVRLTGRAQAFATACREALRS